MIKHSNYYIKCEMHRIKPLIECHISNVQSATLTMSNFSHRGQLCIVRMLPKWTVPFHPSSSFVYFSLSSREPYIVRIEHAFNTQPLTRGYPETSRSNPAKLRVMSYAGLYPCRPLGVELAIYNLHPRRSQGVREFGTEITGGWSLPGCCSSTGVLLQPSLVQIHVDGAASLCEEQRN